MGDGKWVKMVDIGQQRVTIQMCHIPNAQEATKNPSMEPKTCQKGPKVRCEYWHMKLKKPRYGTKNWSKGAKSRV